MQPFVEESQHFNSKAVHVSKILRNGAHVLFYMVTELETLEMGIKKFYLSISLP